MSEKIPTFEIIKTEKGFEVYRLEFLGDYHDFGRELTRDDFGREDEPVRIYKTEAEAKEFVFWMEDQNTNSCIGTDGERPSRTKVEVLPWSLFFCFASLFGELFASWRKYMYKNDDNQCADIVCLHNLFFVEVYNIDGNDEIIDFGTKQEAEAWLEENGFYKE